MKKLNLVIVTFLLALISGMTNINAQVGSTIAQTFTDKNMADGMANVLKKNTSDILTQSDIDNCVDVGVWMKSVESIEGIQYFTKISFLDLSNNKISDISPLTGLTQLEELYLEHNNISDISALSNMTNLNSLYIEENHVYDITPLAGLDNIPGGTLSISDQSVTLPADCADLNGDYSTESIVLSFDGSKSPISSVDNNGWNNGTTISWTGLTTPVTVSYKIETWFRIDNINVQYIVEVFQPLNDYGTSIEDITSEEKLSAYPNPTHSSVTLDLPMESNTEVHYSIYNNVGQVLEQKSVVGVTQLDVNLSNYKAGIYFIGLKTGNNNYMNKVVKE